MSQEKATFYLKLKVKPIVPLDCRTIKPDNFVGKSINDIRKLRIYEGGRRTVLEEIFDVEGPTTAPNDINAIELVIMGEGTHKIRYLGYRMTGGKIIVKGDVGPLAGYKMANGTIVIEGNAGSWLGAKMKNGFIEVRGDAGDFIGAKLQGEKPGKGMKGGMIIIHGNAGSNIGAGMKKGAIIIEGNAGNSVGAYMVGGSILVQGNCGSFTGVRMTGGKIVVNGIIDGILPSFYVDSIVGAAKVKGRVFKKPFMLFIGDALVSGRGMLFVAYEENKTLLEPYKKLIEEVEIT